MDRIEVRVLNPDAVAEAERMMVCAARLTQRGHSIQTMDDFMKLYDRPYKPETAEMMTHLPHSTIRRFADVNVAVIGASRRFLAQITRSQVGVTFMSGSLQYSDYGSKAQFTVPYELLDKPQAKDMYLDACVEAMKTYRAVADIQKGYNDAAGYVAPQGLRNSLIISANPLAWQHMISQRVCRRNTKETAYVMLLIWEQLYGLSSTLFGDVCGPFCMLGRCEEGQMTCGRSFAKGSTPTDILKADFPLLRP